eukprot:CAMPEP_0177651338 /NCGR_PEP_ID=MMETSP0447-20121125/12488_1 /TAXON_ID=0 /ORGANISM="Stygamoeba regulata, Strain BSH-02190019" /LENGTH=140 /DNA_ID=CAMNT_0019154399 /DNA_START=78 /DNA_END=500 /DNA_ORIENTATION=+
MSGEVITQGVQRKPEDSTTNTTVEERDEELARLGSEMFNSVGYYLEGKLEGTAADYALLEAMNKLATDKYRDMADDAEHMASSMETLQRQYTELQPYLQKIDDVQVAVGSLEESVRMLSDYTSRLDTQLAQLSAELRQKR